MMTEFKFCPRCGNTTEAYEIDSKIIPRCSDVSCYYEQWPCMYPAVAVVVVNDQGEAIMIRRANEPGRGLLDWPGGFVDYGELPEAAAVREMKEELGVTVKIEETLGFALDTYQYQEMIIRPLAVGFRASLVDDTVTPHPEEVMEIVWIDPAQEIADTEFAFESCKKFLDLLKEGS